MSDVKKLENTYSFSLKHIFCSLLGIYIFFIPIKIDKKVYTIFYHIVNTLEEDFIDLIKILIITFLTFGCIKSIYKEKKENSIYKYIRISSIFLLFGILYTDIDIFFIDSNVSLIIKEISINFFTTILVGSFFLPLITNYGLIQIFDFYLGSFTKKFFRLSGKSILSLLIYFFTDYFLGYFFTMKLYKKRMLKQYEICMIILNFSIAPYFIFDYLYSNIDFNIFERLLIIVIFLLVNAILCRIYPLNKKKNSYLVKGSYKEPSKKDKNIYEFLNSNSYKTKFLKEVLGNIQEGISILITFLPDVVFSIYVFSIFINNTDIIQILSPIICPIFEFLKVENISQVIEFMFINFFNNILALENTGFNNWNFLMTTIFTLSSVSMSTNMIYINKTKIPISNFEFIVSYFLKCTIIIFVCSFAYYFYSGYVSI